jgi:hypothetical protein
MAHWSGKEKREEKRKKERKKKKDQYSHFTFFNLFYTLRRSRFAKRFLIRGARARKAAPLKEPELFLGAGALTNRT